MLRLVFVICQSSAKPATGISFVIASGLGHYKTHKRPSYQYAGRAVRCAPVMEMHML